MSENPTENSNGRQAGRRKTLRVKINVRDLTNRFGQSIQKYLYKGFHPNVQKNGESARRNGERDCAKPFGNEAIAMNEGELL